MSEYCAEAYFLKEETFTNFSTCKDHQRVQEVMECAGEIIETIQQTTHPPYGLREQVEAIAFGLFESQSYDYPFGLWLSVHALSHARPQKPWIPYPFLSLYELNEELLGSPFPHLKQLFKTLDEATPSAYSFPITYSQLYGRPKLAWIRRASYPALCKEITFIKDKIASTPWEDLLAEDDWCISLEEDNLHQVFDWILEGQNRHEDLVLVVDGS